MSSQTTYIDVMLPLPLAGVFTYAVPEDKLHEIAIGVRVIVPFGNKKIYTAIVRQIHHNAPKDYEVKEILSCLDKYPIVNSRQLQFWDWIADYYQAVLGDVYKAAVPAGMKLESQTRVGLDKDYDATATLTATEQKIVDVLAHAKDVSVAEINKAVQLKNTLPQLKSLMEKGVVVLEDKIAGGYKAKQQELVKLFRNFTEDEISDVIHQLNRAKRQQELLYSYLNLSKYFFEDKPNQVTLLQLLKSCNCSRSILSALVEKQILSIYCEQVERIDLSGGKTEKLKTLNQYQQEAFNEIKQQFQEKNTVLLHGVTSSGKTEIYIHLIAEQIANGKQVLYLLPEIALTTQIINRLKRVFGNKVGVYHSKCSDTERVEIYNNILQNSTEKSYQVILGVRSSVFLPFSDLGLIIVDEEHENTYKQFDPAPRYNARDGAIYLAHLHQAKTLLGTATPSMESYYAAQTGKFGLVELFKRHQNMAMPQILITDIKEARRKKQMKSLFSPSLIQAITESLTNQEQVILFQNRRGYAPYLECRQCGYVPNCPNCSVSLTYHRNVNQLTCHYCGYSTQPPLNCSACDSEDMEDRGFGTEKIEDELQAIFPEARIARMDLDTTRRKLAYEKMIAQFERHQLDILVGTQMVAKGLDFDNVGLVGVLNADAMLNYPDFRAFERSFQMMAQVSGRAGRKNKTGRVLIQTYTPEHPVIKWVVANDYKAMYHNQIEERKTYVYPPFYRLINISLKHKDKAVVNRASDYFAKSLRKIFGVRVFGPHEPIINRIKNQYIVNILLKIEKKSSPAKAKWLLNKQANFLKSQEQFKAVQIVFDVDPM